MLSQTYDVLFPADADDPFWLWPAVSSRGGGASDFLVSLAELRLPLEGDEYDRLGRNVSAQERRQELEPWVLVDRGGLDDNMSSYGD